MQRIIIMQNKYRRAIFLAFIMLFLASIPFILLYTAGYSYNLKKNKFEKTGSLLANTITKDTILYLNGNPYYNKSEFRIKNLLPDEYDVKISKDGYFDWRKKLSVQSELTTFIKDIRLFKKSLAENVADREVKNIYPAPDKNKFVFASQDKKTKKYTVSLFEASGENSKDILSLPQPPAEIVWSNGSDKFFIQTPLGYKIINQNSEDITPAFLTGNKVYNLRWDEKNNSQLFAQNADGIYKIDLFFKTAAKIYSTVKIANFAATADYVYIVDGSALKQISLADRTVIGVPLERNNYKIESIIDKRIYLLNPAGNLQIFNLPLEAQSTPVLLANAKNFDVLGDNLLYYNDFELWIYNFSDSKEEFITRIGEEIKKAQWLNGASDIIYISGNQLKIMELDKRDAKQVWDLAKFDAIDDFILTKNYNVFFTGRLNKAAGIYKLEI